MEKNRPSARQLSVAALTGGLSAAAVFCGETDWRKLLLLIPPMLAVEWLLLRRIGTGPLFCGGRGFVLAAAYAVWSVMLSGAVLYRGARRLCVTNAQDEDMRWILLLMGAILIWSGLMPRRAFFRAAEVFWLLQIPVLAGLLLFAIPNIEWRWLIAPTAGWRECVSAAVVTAGVHLSVLPYIYNVYELRREAGARGTLIRWQAVLGLAGVFLSCLTAGVLSPAAAGQLELPFFAASGALGRSVRGEGIVSSLWLIPDLMLAGLALRVCVGRFGPAVGGAGALLLALYGAEGLFSAEILASAALILVVMSALIPGRKGRVVLSFW